MYYSLSPTISVLLSPRLPEPVGPMSPANVSSSSEEEGEDSGSDSGSSDSSSETPPPTVEPTMPPTAAPPPVEEPVQPPRWNLGSFLPAIPPSCQSDKKQTPVSFSLSRY